MSASCKKGILTGLPIHKMQVPNMESQKDLTAMWNRIDCSEQSRAEQSRAEQSRAEQSRAEQRLKGVFWRLVSVRRLKPNIDI